ncbi:major facilitator superfamily domain-containing protein [Aspergillus sergii]|uniref:Major facilitator superfamily domain-containing protein n=1 Tax=Aspergillus sergii TaxID=1034303 RepID=A0A5N6X3J1_9EURO|nr:major facilitator superfamily domain-containing protein [Aspergillus sergii]
MTAPADSTEKSETSETTTLQTVEVSTTDVDPDLPRVLAKVPGTVWVVAFIAAAERFTYWGITTPWQNYMQNPAGHQSLPGALGLGEAKASTIYNVFMFFSYLTPIPFAIISDVYLGRYRTLRLSLIFYLIGCVILIATSVSSATEYRVTFGGLIAAMVLIGLAVGGVRATVTPLMMDQYAPTEVKVTTLPNGKQVVYDRGLTTQYIYNAQYWHTRLVNIASLSAIPTTFIEKNVSFWAAYLLPSCFLAAGLALLIIGQKRFRKLPPTGNILPKAGSVLSCAIRGRFQLDAAMPSYQREHFAKEVSWDETFVNEIRRGLVACRVILGFILFFTCLSQASNNLISQAGQMKTYGIPNDTITAMNPIFCVIMGPVIQKGLYPLLNKNNVKFQSITRMATGFIMMSASMAFAAGVQKIIYDTGPCYDRPLTCPGAENGRIPNQVNVFLQTPTYIILAVAEIFSFVTLSEYTYTKAPTDMKAVVQALGQLGAAAGSAIGIAITPLAHDPSLIWMYTGLAVAMFLVAVVFWILFKKYNAIDREDK